MTGSGECDFDWDATATEVIHMIRATGPACRSLLGPYLVTRDSQATLRVRPRPDVWSALEYTVHLREALAFYDERVRRVVTEDRPRLPAYGFATACDERRYNDEDPRAAVDELAAVAMLSADRLARLSDEMWARVGIGSEGGERTALVLARRAAHECEHHTLDLRRVLAARTA